MKDDIEIFVPELCDIVNLSLISKKYKFRKLEIQILSLDLYYKESYDIETYWQCSSRSSYLLITLVTPRARGHVFVLVALASHEKLALRYFNGASVTCFRDFSLNKILITFRNVRGLPGTNSHLPRTVTCRATLLSERGLISRTLLRRRRFVVLWRNEVKNQNSA